MRGQPRRHTRGAGGRTSYVVDGMSPERIAPIIETAIARFEAYQALKAELTDAKDKLSERKLVEKAKGILMKSRKLPEDQAYHALRKLAMDKNQGSAMSRGRSSSFPSSSLSRFPTYLFWCRARCTSTAHYCVNPSRHGFAVRTGWKFRTVRPGAGTSGLSMDQGGIGLALVADGIATARVIQHQRRLHEYASVAPDLDEWPFRGSSERVL